MKPPDPQDARGRPPRGDDSAEAPTVGPADLPTLGESDASPLREGPGTRIGPYRIVESIGEGGFGSVFLAEQEEPVRRRVALKVIKLGMDTRSVVARFEQERQALALMDHPNIAKVFDAGATDSGRPYFVMELVTGAPITDYCDRSALPIRERLTLFAQVCRAVQHAHQKGLIHRDIKPSNVLVATQDEQPHAKVIDFGIAKATAARLTERTLFTEHRQLIGTPEYMSPEQAAGSLDIDTRTDVYALGVLLYELLTGSIPFDSHSLRSAAYGEIQRIIREVEPPRPSTRLSQSTQTLASVATRRRTEPRNLTSTLRGELDWIVMKAIDKDRQRRYDTATDLAKDIERYLNQQPVAAGPPSATYRLHKFVRRHKVGVGLSATAAVVLVAFAVALAIQARRIVAERDRANRMLEFQTGMLTEVKPRLMGDELVLDLRERKKRALADGGASDAAARAALSSLDAALEGISMADAARRIIDVNILGPATETIAREFSADPETDARLRHAIARTYRSLGMPDKAVPQAELALELRREALGAKQRDALRIQALLGVLQFELGRLAESRAILDQVAPELLSAFGPEDRDTLLVRICQGVLLMEDGKNDEARKTFEEVLVTQERVFGPDDKDVAATLNNLAQSLMNLRKFEDAVPMLERALRIRTDEVGPDDPATLDTRQRLARLYHFLKRTDEAYGIQLETIEILERSSGERHPDTISAVAMLANMYKNEGRLAEAESLATKALALRRAVLGDSHSQTLRSLDDMAILYSRMDRQAEAERLFVEALERSTLTHGADSPATLDRVGNLAVSYWFQGRFDKAEPLFVRTLEATRAKFGEKHAETAFAMNNLAILYTRLGRLDEARPLLEQALAINTAEFGPKDERTLQATASVASLEFSARNYERARAIFVELYANQQEALGQDHVLTLESGYNLATVQRKLGLEDDAETLFVDVLARRKKSLGPTHPQSLDTAESLATLYVETKRPDQARPLIEQALAARRAAAEEQDATPAQLDAYATVLLTCPLAELRDPKAALSVALALNERSGQSDPAFLKTLARAYFDSGDPVEAIETQRRALKRLPEQAPDRAEYEETLSGYLRGVTR